MSATITIKANEALLDCQYFNITLQTAEDIVDQATNNGISDQEDTEDSRIITFPDQTAANLACQLPLG